MSYLIFVQQFTTECVCFVVCDDVLLLHCYVDSLTQYDMQAVICDHTLTYS